MTQIAFISFNGLSFLFILKFEICLKWVSQLCSKQQVTHNTMSKQTPATSNVMDFWTLKLFSHNFRSHRQNACRGVRRSHLISLIRRYQTARKLTCLIHGVLKSHQPFDFWFLYTHATRKERGEDDVENILFLTAEIEILSSFFTRRVVC